MLAHHELPSVPKATVASTCPNSSALGSHVPAQHTSCRLCRNIHQAFSPAVPRHLTQPCCCTCSQLKQLHSAVQISVDPGVVVVGSGPTRHFIHSFTSTHPTPNVLHVHAVPPSNNSAQYLCTGPDPEKVRPAASRHTQFVSIPGACTSCTSRTC